MLPINFHPGPSQLYFTVPDHLRKAFKDGIPSLSHRSKKFEDIYRSATENLKALLGLPDDFWIFFAGSATEIWERIIQNLVEQTSTHFVNGAFSQRFYDTAVQLKKHPELIKVEDGNGFDTSFLKQYNTEVLAVTHNETSTGVSTPIDFIHRLKDLNPSALLAVDAVSSLPYPSFDYTKVDSIFFSVQKSFGLPAGLGVWIVNENCLAKADKILTRGYSTGTYHSLASLHSFAKKNQTPETPNVVGIYLLNAVTNDLLARGLTTIRRETDYKATLLYQLLNNHGHMKPFVQQREFQSRTVVVAECEASRKDKIVKLLASKGMDPGEGYGQFKNKHLRFGNFPTHSKEQYELLVDTLSAIH